MSSKKKKKSKWREGMNESADSKGIKEDRREKRKELKKKRSREKI